VLDTFSGTGQDESATSGPCYEKPPQVW